MRIEDFLSRHGLRVNPFANAEEALGDVVLERLLEERNFHYGHPQWPKFCGDPPGNQTSMVFGLKGSGKTAMRLALTRGISEHNGAHPEDRTLLVDYEEFNTYLDSWKAHVEREIETQRTFWDRLLDKPREHATQNKHWKLAHHVDAIIAESTRLFEGLFKDASKVRRWDAHTKYDALFLAAAYLPERSSDYLRAISSLHQVLFSPSERMVSNMAHLLGGILTLGIYPAYRWFSANSLAHHISRAVQVIERSPSDLRSALLRIPPTYLKVQGLADKSADINAENTRYEALDKLLRIAQRAGYPRLTVIIDKVDEPTMISGDYDKMADFIIPLWNNKILQMAGLSFKMLLPAQIHERIRKANSELSNVARLDKANVIYPFTWSGEHLYEILSERAAVCAEGGVTREFALEQLFDDEITRDMLIAELAKLALPRHAGKFMYRCLSDACTNLIASDLAEGKQPKIPARVYYKVVSDFDTELRNYAQDLQEY